MKKIAVIGAGVSGLTCARELKDRNKVTVFEKESTPGGLIRCRRIEGSLFHICGGHVFNTRNQNVLDWFWNIFNKSDWRLTDRNSVVFMNDGLEIPYPIENHVYLFGTEVQKSFINDLVEIAADSQFQPSNFEEFLKHRFGSTLYRMYFQPYNEKVWRRDLRHVPLSWLEGKLPMPTVAEMIYNNINHVKEKQFVHSTFWYEKHGGSQLIADTLAKGLDIRYEADVKTIEKDGEHWKVCGEEFDTVIFCGNLKDLPSVLKGAEISNYTPQIDALEYHGTTSVFCEIENNPYSWIYLPSRDHESHRIICTGNFSPTNNAEGKMTATVEFTDKISEADIKKNLAKIPLNPRYITHHYNRYTYPVQDSSTRKMIKSLKSVLSARNFFLTGRFADWEYYNMDAAMGAALELCKTFK